MYMHKRGFLLIVTLLLTATAAPAALEDTQAFNEVYFIICGDAECTDIRTIYEIDDSPVYIRAFKTEGLSLQGQILLPDSTIKELDFKNQFTTIRLSQTGQYFGSLTATKQGIPHSFQQNFEFTVVDKLPEIIDLSTPSTCSEVEPIIVEYEQLEILTGSLPGNERTSLRLILTAQDRAQTHNFLEGTITNDWECPNPGDLPGISCKTERFLKRLHSYTPQEISITCGSSTEGEISLRGERFILGSKKGTMQDALQEATLELELRSQKVQCPAGCTKEIKFGIIRAKDTLLNLLGASYTFGYQIDCLEERAINNEDWNFGVFIDGEQHCVQT
jgi:hypothetical protein